MTAKNDQITVYVIEDDASVLASLCAMLKAHDLTPKACETAEAYLEAYDPQEKAVVLLDLRLPGLSGLELQEHLNNIDAHLPVVVLTAHGDVPTAVQAMRAGAYDFIEKPADPIRVVEAIREAAGAVRAPSMTGPGAQIVTQRLASLTPREREVLELLLDGKQNKEIAEVLSVSRRTVEVYRARIREKMHARGIADLFRMMN